MRRLTLVGPMEKRSEVFDALVKVGARTVRVGPYTNKRMHPKVDASRFLIIVDVPSP